MDLTSHHRIFPPSLPLKHVGAGSYDPHLPPYHAAYYHHRSAPPVQQSQGQGDSSSLSSISERFVELLNSVSPPYGQGDLDLNNATEKLNVPKRRLYDITNVLEGIGLIKKENKNYVSWVQLSPQRPIMVGIDDKQEKIKKEIEAHKCKCKQLDNYIEILSKRVRDYTDSESTETNAAEKNISKKLFVTKQDISSLQNYANDTVIAIRAPSGTSLEVPNPDEGMRPGMRRFQIFLTSPAENSGQVNVVLVQHGDKKDAEAVKENENIVDNHIKGLQSSQSSAPRLNPNLGSSTYPSSSYPVQAQRTKHHQDRFQNDTNIPSKKTLPPQLPPPDSLPKYVSPIQTKQLPHRPRLNGFSNKKPDLVMLQQRGSKHDSSSKASGPPLLSQRSSSDYLQRKRKSPSPVPPSNSMNAAKSGLSDHFDVPFKTKCSQVERAISPITAFPQKKNKSPSDKTTASNDPVSPSCFHAAPKIFNQSSFDLLNVPLHSPSAAFLASPAGLLASPSITGSGSGNMKIMGTSAMLNSPFRFSPSFHLGDLSPFFPTSNGRMGNRGGHHTDKSESDDKVSSALFG